MEPAPEEVEDEAQPAWRWGGVAASSAFGAVGGALGYAAVAAAGPVGAVAAIGAAAAAAVSAARLRAAADAPAPQEAADELAGPVIEDADSSEEEPAQLPAADGPRPIQMAAAVSDARAEAPSFAEELLSQGSFLERVRLLQRLHDRDPAAIERLSSSEGLECFGSGSAMCFLRCSSQRCEVYFLGSEADFQRRPQAFAECWLHTNARIQLQPLDGRISHEARGHVHMGFQSSYLGVAQRLGQLASATVSIMGYSLGGALATLAALDLCCKGFTRIELITFGSPRLGNESFRDYFNEKCLATGVLRVVRFVNTLDLVPHVPFNPEDAVDSSRQGQLWRCVEQTLLARLPQERLTGDAGSYVHVTPGTVLDGLSTGVAGVVSRLANIAEWEGRLSLSSLPAEFMSEHCLSSYLRTVEAAPRPAWVTLSSTLLESSPLRVAMRSLRSSAPAAAAPLEVATSAGISAAGLVLPQILGAAVSAIGCYCVAQEVTRVSQQLTEHANNTSRSLSSLETQLGRVAIELHSAQQSVQAALQGLSQSIRQQRSEDLARRARVAQRQLAEEMEVYLARPSAAHAQLVREGARELRRAAAEIIELIQEEQDAEPAELARLWLVALSAHRLALWSVAMADSENAALRAAQALSHVAPLLGRFFWLHVASGQETWLQDLEQNREQFLAVALTLASSAAENSLRLEPESQLYTCLGLDPGSSEIRVSLALHFLADPTVECKITPAARHWLTRGSDANSQFLSGLAALLPGGDLQLAADQWNGLALEGFDLVASLRALPVPADLWSALAGVCQPRAPLAAALLACRRLPAPANQQLQAWLRQVVSLDHLQGSSSAVLQQMSHALAHDSRDVEDLLGRSRELFYDLAAMAQLAHQGPAQFAIRQLCDALDEDLEALNREERFVVFSGLVSAGKTSLINSILLQLLPLQELKEDASGRRNLMPTSFSENTRIVTQLELCPEAEHIEVRLLEKVCQPAQSVGTAVHSGFRLCEGYPERLAGPRPWRRLQRRLRQLCTAETGLRRLQIRLPCPLDHPVSIIDTPGLDSSEVWQHVEELVRSKAFLLVWVAALDAPTTFGTNGEKLLELYRSSGHSLPPVLVLTKWDRLQSLPEFDPDSLQGHLRQRFGALKRSLCSTTVSDLTSEDIETLISALSPSCDAASLTRDLTLHACRLPQGSKLCQESEARTNVADYLRSLETPAKLRFQTEEHLLLAASNAAAALQAVPEAADEVVQLWQSLLSLLAGVSEPLRISCRLQKIVVASQQAANILLKDDDQAVLFSADQLQVTQQSLAASFRQRLDGYFQDLPSNATELASYKPPQGLPPTECATCLIPEFVKVGHDTAKSETRHADYVRCLAQLAMEQWQAKFLENMVRLEQSCFKELQRQLGELLQCGLQEAWQASGVRRLAASPLRALRAGATGYLLGGTASAAAELLGASLSLGLPGLCMALAAAYFLEDSQSRLGSWSYEEAQRRAVEMVLEILSRPDFQTKAKETVLEEFQRCLTTSLAELSEARDASASSSSEAQAAVSLQARVKELQESLSSWFNHFVTEQLSRDPWLIPAPENLRLAMESEEKAESSDSE
ncbi:unnamed protein product [Effrenium voratum]|nr:unnamed protein product [Effrenium voratum]